MKAAKVLVAGLFCMVLLASPAFASSGHVQQSQSLSLILQGVISNAGSQQFQLSGGKLASGAQSSLLGQPLSSQDVRFNLAVSVHGLQPATGRGSLSISAKEDQDHSRGDEDNSNGAEFSAQISITGEIPAAIFPITLTSQTTYSPCDPTVPGNNCNSEIPLFFTGVATVQSQGGHDASQIPIAIESPYWSPFGGPILIVSLDSATNPSIYLVVSYESATINWSGVQLVGAVAGGLFGTEPITSGNYGQSVFSQENLVTGNEFDLGKITFAGMSDLALDGSGGFYGRTTIATAGSFDCSPEFAFPGVPPLPESPQTCTATGANSAGSFFMAGQGTFVSGSYNTVWSVPSLFTVTTVIGAVYQH
jgi:hypothetical protein